MEKPPTPSDDARKARSDGVQSRERLLLAAMRLFAEQGFAKTSTREIALAASTNVASISYYFGDKAGLYRAAFTEPAPCSHDTAFNSEALSLRESLGAFYAQLLAPLKQGDIARLCMRMWYREMLEPTGLWHEEIDTGIKPAYAGLIKVLERHMGAPHDDELSRLAFAIVGMATHLMVGRDVIDEIRPQLLADADAVDAWMASLVNAAEALVEAERRRRSDNPSPTSGKTNA